MPYSKHETGIVNTDKKFFAAANTSAGFICYYDEIFSDLNKLYIIKGGPGTGKSHLISQVGAKAAELGYGAEYFCCSLDPTSLDGIIITELGVGVIDGTAPHIKDPKYPGVIDEIINLGEFWHGSELEAKRGEIITLISKKSALMNNAYKLLSAAGKVDGEIKAFEGGALICDKLRGAMGRLTREWKKGSGYRAGIRLISGITNMGRIELDTFSQSADKQYFLTGSSEIAYIALAEIAAAAKDKEQPVYISYDQLDASCINGLYLPELGISFSQWGGEDGKIINTERFVDRDALRAVRKKLRFLTRCRDSLVEGAVDSLIETKELHAQLEDIYIKAMDFTKKEKRADELIEKIFGV